MKRALRNIILISIINFFCCGISEATVINADWKIAGDGLAILDTTNNKEWLDLTETANLTTDYVFGQLGPGGEFEGWHIATALEALELLVSAEIPDIDNQWTAANVAPVEQLFGIWGELGNDPFNGIRVSYFAIDHLTTQYCAGSIAIGSSTYEFGKGYAREFSYGNIDTEYHNPLFGVALVRVVPEPASLLLLAFGGLLIRYRK